MIPWPGLLVAATGRDAHSGTCTYPVGSDANSPFHTISCQHCRLEIESSSCYLFSVSIFCLPTVAAHRLNPCRQLNERYSTYTCMYMYMYMYSGLAVGLVLELCSFLCFSLLSCILAFTIKRQDHTNDSKDTHIDDTMVQSCRVHKRCSHVYTEPKRTQRFDQANKSQEVILLPLNFG